MTPRGRGCVDNAADLAYPPECRCPRGRAWRGLAGQGLVHQLAQLRADGVRAGWKKLGKERDGQLFSRVDPERGAGRAAPGQLACETQHLAWHRVQNDGQAKPEADPAERGLRVQRPAERLQVGAAGKVVTGHVADGARAEQPGAVQLDRKSTRLNS